MKNSDIAYISDPRLRAIIYFLLVLMAVVYLFPMYVMITTSFKSLDEIRLGNMMALPDVFTFSAWSDAWSKSCIGVECSGLKGYFFNSIKFTVPAVFLATLLGSLNGYVLTKWKFKGHQLIFGLMLFGCFIPFQAILIPMAQFLGKLKLSQGPGALILVHFAYGIGFSTLFFRNYYMTFPDEVLNAAKIEGAGFFSIYLKILLPVSLPIVMVSVIWLFTNIWNDFLFGVSFSGGGSFPVTVALNNLVNSSTGGKRYNIDMAGAIISAAPTLLVYILVGKYFVRGLLAGSVKK